MGRFFYPIVFLVAVFGFVFGGTVEATYFQPFIKNVQTHQNSKQERPSDTAHNEGKPKCDELSFEGRLICDPVSYYTRALTYVTASLVVGTIVLAFFTWKIWSAGEKQRRVSESAVRVAREANVASQETGRAQVRAYLTCTGGTYKIDSHSVICWPTIANSGQSPAKRIRIVALMEITLEPREVGRTIPRLQVLRTIEHEGGCQIVPSQDEKGGIMLFAHTDIGKDGFEALRQARTEFRIVGRLYWEDVFDLEQSIPIILYQQTPYITTPSDEIDRTGELSAFNQGHEKRT